jgi:hypothetical protein
MSTPVFVLEPEELSTPTGLATACQRARAFVEEHLPARHQPGPGTYFWGSAPDGCCCAIGFLHAAVAGELVAWSDSVLDQIGPKGKHRIAFEYGFDSAWNWQGTERAAGIAAEFEEWREVGYQLGLQWRRE